MLDLYTILLSIHIVAAVLWIGGGLFNTILIGRIRAAGDAPTLAGFLRQGAAMGPVYGGASLVLVLTGFGLIADGDWDFDLWIILALVAWLGAAVHGAAVLGKGFEAVGRELGGGATIQAVDDRLRNVLLHARVELTILVLVIFDMVIKPGT